MCIRTRVSAGKPCDAEAASSEGSTAMSTKPVPLRAWLGTDIDMPSVGACSRVRTTGPPFRSVLASDHCDLQTAHSPADSRYAEDLSLKMFEAVLQPLLLTQSLHC
ncbi:unnamed protein product [Symbiodinium natans]|uniref:Uncharacterized protein n=1 Tax=Symbiodinium natans TaxID=878477 RepID=A0A812H7H1_9DINO|nr:unnamed protein product [Symbiodinium natans]